MLMILSRILWGSREGTKRCRMLELDTRITLICELACRDVRKQIGAFAAPDVIHYAPGLPKTRSGKIMRRILRKVASNEVDQLGDISTLADPSIVQTLIELRP